ncbi:PLP-dependent transferase [Lentilactobacillus parabuchneri]|jgi:cystathionine beta-lyase|uniref:cysteine-S-conjugate beta-lyase n=2 Tax=Lentilactobacillus parabuchneri TaxID=152331 RepID=A0A844EKD5_9LACO|nr:PLP-dependent aspartate aminotransferase family protein [Lentilactobacillus parabuchneri]APR07402.1 Cystathionine beta-lyase [Lentilactobacillus parabuchneri]KRM47247.1 Cys Met metabolism pyridoxal-phosphate-dependent protein [Lentilactobacillus parabuchneri DSM 5707 = NBRC 107865]MBW0223133.1 PLP-dependent aspartate aminotransferase family protein [Lentilactobacillus parabuchneri]MBW0245441.1 PLP-dependent aspartate aminotransferase family protein [Lentilactobacillus parabuchneri]MBW026396
MVKFNTLLVRGGRPNDNTTGAVNVPIYNSSTFRYPKLGSDVKWDYERSGNPTRDAVEDVCAALENGDRGFAFSSGMAAIHAALSLFKPGDHVIIGDNIYGGTFRLVNDFLKPRGVEFTEVDTQDTNAVAAAFQDNTKGVYFEPVTNPLLKVSSVKQIAKIAHQHDALVIVDNTFLTPYLQRPLDLGADVVLHSATKYLGGHSDFTAGMIVTKNKELSNQIYAVQNTIGAVLAPQEANLLRRGIQTLNIRMDRHIQNAEKIIAYLKSNPKVAKIYYPTVDQTSDDFKIISEEAKGAGGVLSFEIKDGLDAAKFVNSLQLIILAVSLGAAESLVEVPAFMSHFEIPKPERLKMGIKDELIRLSVGLEDPDDLIADLKQAFEQI